MPFHASQAVTTVNVTVQVNYNAVRIACHIKTTQRCCCDSRIEMSKKFKITRPHAQVKMRKANETGKVSTNLKFFLTALTAICFRWSTGFGTYSGFNNPPMYGDFEAQRHWMEITVNLPLKEWYIHTNSNDLMYWGLDYPPLTAYHSFLFGKLAQYFNASWVELYKSRGSEGTDLKLFMRYTVLISDVLVFFTSCYAYSKSLPLHVIQLCKSWSVHLDLYITSLEL
ncbi:dolichyl pyrophosphate Man9GlcNAc2 alpha-1,3-glucosyltransferase [Trichinella spiralis]|uniref:dolichyl pyrophosphate Man9GlcNAc2 alpha-1,3-glucosyltransferase n=1 Tax=Trichinella spiralis TaxID=6334 RepID=UPI0001EFB5A7|nr:dolichyl pyrophosphate Man9GlcNAc2 alpha-1,3-glucosyltransferase [Trichinella spiralis]